MEHSSCLLLLNVPSRSLGGIDLLSFTTSPKFRGFKRVPAGLHFTFASTTNALSERHGLWFIVQQNDGSASRQLTIAQWDGDTDSLVCERRQAEQMRWRANLGSIFHEHLSPYRQNTSGSDADGLEQTTTDESTDWQALSSYITPDLLNRIFSTSTPEDWTLSSGSSARQDFDAIPGLTIPTTTASVIPNSEKELKLLPIDLSRTWPLNATGRERTIHARDRSWALINLVQNATSATTLGDGPVWQPILGELQFTFLMLITLNNWSCLEQWKRILSLVLTSTTAITDPAYTSLFPAFITVLHTQLTYLTHSTTSLTSSPASSNVASSGSNQDSTLIDLTDTDGSLLHSLLVRFRQSLNTLISPVQSTPPTTTIQESSSESALTSILTPLSALETFFRKEHNWHFPGDGPRTSIISTNANGEIHDEGADVEIDDEDDDEGEYAPVVVELTEEQAALLGVVRDDQVTSMNGDNEGAREKGDVKDGGGRLGRGGLGDETLAEVVQEEYVSEGEDGESGEKDEDGDGSDVERDNGEEVQDLDEMDSRY